MTALRHGSIRYHEGSWLVDAAPHVAVRLKRIFRVDDRGAPGRLKMTATPEACRDLSWVLERFRLEIDPRDLARLRAGAERHRAAEAAVARCLSADYEPRAWPLALPPRTYQSREAEIALSTGRLLIADVVGLGKTCAAIAVLSGAEDALPAVVTCPVHLARQWVDEIGKFAPRLRAHVLARATPYKLPTADVVVAPYSKLAGWAQALSGGRFRTAVFDEVQELRHPTTARYAAATSITRGAAYRIGLSATPIYNYGGEVFNVLSAVAPGVLGTWAEFAAEWCAPAAGGHWKLRDPRAFGAWARDAGLIVRHTREEVGLELPPVTRVSVEIDADEEALAAVAEPADRLVEILLGNATPSERFAASEKLVTLLRRSTGVAKAPYVAEFVRLLVESGEQVLLAGWHRDFWQIVEDRLGLAGVPVAYYTGTESATQKIGSKHDFVSGRARVLFMSLRSGAGLNDLQNASSVVVHGELDWSFAVHEQITGRLDRQGQRRNVLAYFLLAPTGSDEVMSRVLGLKQQQLDGIRDPFAVEPPVELREDADRVRALAEAWLSRRRGPSARTPASAAGPA